MTMTDTEAKALALELRAAVTPRGKINRPFFSIVIDAAEYIEATEARHAAVLRELKERFSEVLGQIKKKFIPFKLGRTFDELAAPFILPAPDPLAEALDEAWDEVGRPAQANRLRAAMQDRGYEWRKIGEAGE